MSVKYTLSKKFLSVAISSVFIIGCGGGDDDDLKDTKKDTEIVTPPAVSPPEVEKATIIVPDSITIQEPKEGIEEVQFDLQLNKPAPYNFDVEYELIDGSALSNGEFKSYSKSDQKLTFLEGQKKSTGIINIYQNGVFENDTNFFFKVTGIKVPNDLDAVTFNSDEKTIVTVRNTTSRPIVTIPLNFKTVVEGVNDVITLNLDNYSSTNTTLTISTSGSVSKSDYLFNNGNGVVLTIPAYQKSLATPLAILSDHLPEGGEKLTLSIQSAIGVEVEKDNSSIDIFIPGSYGLNDTGVITFSDGVNFNIENSPSEYPNQDANYGNDKNGGNTLAHAGFSFVKLDVNGNTLNASATNFSCIKDNRTGMFIEKKTSPDNASAPSSKSNWRSSSYVYNWYNKNSDMNGGSNGTVGERTQEGEEKGWLHGGSDCAFLLPNSGETKPQNCNTQEYLAELNRRAICGVNDWRLPSPSEIRSVYNYASENELDSIDYFPNIFDVMNQSSTVLTGSTSVDNTGSVWCFDLKDGSNKMCHKGLANMIIAVRDGEQ